MVVAKEKVLGGKRKKLSRDHDKEEAKRSSLGHEGGRCHPRDLKKKQILVLGTCRRVPPPKEKGDVGRKKVEERKSRASRLNTVRRNRGR